MIVIIAIAAVAYLKWDWLHAQYTHTTQVKFNKGDKVYVAKNRFENEGMSSLGIFRLIKPTNNKGESILLIQNIVELSKLKDHRSSYLGNYVAQGYYKFKVGDTQSKDSFLRLKISPELLTDVDDKAMPAGYNFADSDYYVFEESVGYSEVLK
ncbi:hypothetical protein [Mucilaginibacter terrae]|uniref:Uncharacterized protein n=1 Tax=Mucilaginibacter terrae TaxID=1955052 RepID=A0ABU3GZA8_9SPHI|nr:hypothetical protein [Mucilaginibacter terrae]MDT3405108.1 hypothetical protein [Mucilaginibacter terrae]